MPKEFPGIENSNESVYVYGGTSSSLVPDVDGL